MRAKVVSVALVACGVLGAIGVGLPSSTMELAARGGHDHGGEGGHDNGQHDNKYDHACTSNDHAVVGNVCVIVDDLPILGSILTS
jgi:hypothetical protein